MQGINDCDWLSAFMWHGTDMGRVSGGEQIG